MVDLRLRLGPVDFAFRERDCAIDVHEIALAQQSIIEHRAERRRERHGEPERNTIANQTFKYLPEWQIRFRNRLEQPIFFQEVGVFWMSNKWQMGVENKS